MDRAAPPEIAHPLVPKRSILAGFNKIAQPLALIGSPALPNKTRGQSPRLFHRNATWGQALGGARDMRISKTPKYPYSSTSKPFTIQ